MSFRRSACLLLAGLTLAVILPFTAARAIPSDGIDTPLPSRVDKFNPDQRVCTPAAIRTGFASQMQPWADQPPAVLARLKEVQLEMTRDTLRRCVSKGLMDRTQAEQLFEQLIAEPAASPVPSSSAPAPSTPAVSPASTRPPASPFLPASGQVR